MAEKKHARVVWLLLPNGRVALYQCQSELASRYILVFAKSMEHAHCNNFLRSFFVKKLQFASVGAIAWQKPLNKLTIKLVVRKLGGTRGI